MLPDEVLDKANFAEAGVGTVRIPTSSPLKVPVLVVFMSNPIHHPPETLGISAVRKAACERLDIGVNMFCPVGWVPKRFYFEADRTFKFGRQTVDGREGDSDGELELCLGNTSFIYNIVLLAIGDV